MRTEDDIRDALATSLERHALSRDTVVARLRGTDSTGGPNRRRPRPGMLVAVAATTAAAIVAVPLVLRSGGDASDAPATALATRMWRQLPFTLDLPPGWQETGRAITSDSMANGIASPSSHGDAVCVVAAYRTGRFDTSRIPADREPVTVNGKPGFFAEVGFGPDKVVRGQPIAITQPAIAWLYAADSWAVSYCPGARPAEQRALVQQMAEAATFTAGGFPVPVKMGYVPPGFETAIALAPEEELLTPQMSSRGSTIEFTKDGLRCDSTTDAPAGDHVHSVCAVKIVAANFPKNAKSPIKVGPPVSPITINGQHAWYYVDGQTTVLVVAVPQVPAHGNGYYLNVELPVALPDVRGELRKIAEQIQIAPDLTDQSTWFDAETSLP